jgi:hypothetical protein
MGLQSGKPGDIDFLKVIFFIPILSKNIELLDQEYAFITSKYPCDSLIVNVPHSAMVRVGIEAIYFR